MIEIIPIPAFSDNYIWAVVDKEHQVCVCVDPGDAAPVEQFLKQNQLKLHAILITHHHFDHIGGVAQLKQNFACPVYGPETINEVTHSVTEGDQVEVLNQCFSVLATPGHTLDHLSYYCEPWLFCGDTLFSAGCGRVFEGTAAMMWNSLKKLRQLPDQTEVYCTHEYTLSNIKFARSIDSDNEQLASYQQNCQIKRGKAEPTLPCLLGNEKKTNPFLRCDNSELKAIANQIAEEKAESPEQIFAIIREWKDHF